MTTEWECDACQHEEAQPLAPCGEPGCDCGHTIETLRRKKAEMEKGFRDLLTECESIQSLFVRGPQKIWVEKAHDKISEVIFAARAVLANTKETP